MKAQKILEVAHPREQKYEDLDLEEGTTEETAKTKAKMNKEERWLLQRDTAIQKTTLNEIKK